MKIIQVQTQAEAAGAQRVSDIVGEGLRQRGHEVRTVFLYRRTGVYDQDPYADYILRDPPRGPLAPLQAMVGLIGYMRAQKPDSVLSYQHFGTVFGTIAGRLAGARTLVANQSGVPLRGGARGVATALDKLMGAVGLYHHSVVNSAWTEGQFAGYPASYRRRIRRIDHGVAGPESQYDKRAARAAFGLPPDVRLVVTTGRLQELKNHVVLVEALRSLPDDVHLAIGGAGPEHKAIVAAAERLQLGRRLHMAGEIPPSRIFEFLAAGDVYGFASTQETFGLAVAEAAISGLPVVASDIDVLQEVLRTASGEPAALFAPGLDPVAMGRAIAEVLEDEGLAARLSAAGEELGRKYAPAEMCAAYEALIR